MKENAQEFLILIILAAARTEFNVSDDAAKNFSQREHFIP
jgi:hypothetical protein